MPSAFEQAYLRIRDMITTGELGAGDALIPDDLARLCGVSRTPVREAIFRLEAEMFVTRLDNKRTIVRAWSVDEVDIFIELRVRVGGLVAARAAANIDAAALAELATINDEHSAFIDHGGESAEVLALTRRFYEILIAATRSDRLAAISYQLVNPAPLIRQIERRGDLSMADMLAMHRDLVQACGAHDPRWAEATMVAFVRRTYRPDILARIRS